METGHTWCRQMRSTAAFLKGLLRNLINLLEKHLRDPVHRLSWQTAISVTAISGSVPWSTEKIRAKGIIQGSAYFLLCTSVCLWVCMRVCFCPHSGVFPQEPSTLFFETISLTGLSPTPNCIRLTDQWVSRAPPCLCLLAVITALCFYT